MLQEIRSAINAQKTFFKSGGTRDVTTRIETLRLMKKIVNDYRKKLAKAIYEDLKKSHFEFFVTEIALVVDEMDLHIKNLNRWSSPQKVRSSLLQYKSSSYIYPEPYGQVLIISPWNYPFQLNFLPMTGAISTGNTVILKPSPDAPNTADVMEEMISRNFDPEYITVFKGGRKTNQLLLGEKFDLIFFTGSPRLGKIVMKAASENLTPVILELGGKSPCIVHRDADPVLAAKRIIWGKHLNAGQTCTAPDYLLVHSEIKQDLFRQMVTCIKRFWGDNPKQNPDYSRIVSLDQMKRLAALMKSENIVYGGDIDMEERYISPTIIDNVKPDAPIMREEIFGPVLPMIEYSDLDQAVNYINSNPKPLALYLFTKDTEIQNRVLNSTSSGGCTINDTLMHVTNSNLPFGGVGQSGMGRYHGRSSFDAFSNKKSVLIRSNMIDPSIRYAPYSEGKKRIMEFLMTGRITAA